jgi:hypothetical protein
VTAESASDRERQWALAVRRSFGIPDFVSNEDAREALIVNLEDLLQESGWRSAKRGICEPMVDALLALEARADLGVREGASRLIGKGITVVDPERLVFDARFEYPPEVVAVAQQALDRVDHYVRERPGT